MVQLRLPENSKIKKGKTFASHNANKTFQIYRYNPDTNQNPSYDQFELDTNKCGPMVLDALIKIKEEVECLLGVVFNRGLGFRLALGPVVS